MAMKTTKTATQSTAPIGVKKNLYNSTVYRSLAMHNVKYMVYYTYIPQIFTLDWF